jgi:hypothetical protein
MRKLLMAAFAFALLAIGAGGLSAQMEMAETEEVEFTATVVDLSCKVVYNLTGDMHRECAQVCADKGITLGLMNEDGYFFVPVDDAMPGTGANEMLKPHAEHTVNVKGRVVKRGGMNAIIIDEISM